MGRNLPGPASPRLATPHNVEAALDELGIEYTVRGDEAVALCPNPDHRDRNPSWSCNLTTGMHNCFSCGFKGSFVRLVMTMRGMPYRDASDWSRSFIRSAEEITARLNDHTPGQRVRQMSEADLALFSWAPQWALDERKITFVAAQTYGVLWDDELDEDNEETGRGSWILPVRDPHTRRLRGWQRKGDSLVKNVPFGLEKADTLFGFHLLKPGKPVVVVESPLDAVRLWSAGVFNAVATYGSNFSEAQVLLILDDHDELIDAFDDDKAGHKASARLRHEYGHRFRALREFHYGKTGAKDPGDMENDDILEGIARAR